MSVAATAVAEAGKIAATVRVGLTGLMAYRLNLFLQVIGPAVVFFVVKINLWTTVYGQDPRQLIGSYDLDRMLTYQAWVLFVSLIVHGFNSQNLAEDIRLGRISSYLLYPFGFWRYHASRFLAFLTLQTVVAVATACALSALGALGQVTWAHAFYGYFLCLAVSFLWFNIQFVLGICAFWMEETWVLRVMFLIIASFLSGSLIPIDLFPSWLREVLFYTPFPYMTYVPALVLMGQAPLEPMAMAGALGIWGVLVGVLVRITWARGLRHYSGAGI